MLGAELINIYLQNADNLKRKKVAKQRKMKFLALIFFKYFDSVVIDI